MSVIDEDNVDGAVTAIATTETVFSGGKESQIRHEEKDILSVDPWTREVISSLIEVSDRERMSDGNTGLMQERKTTEFEERSCYVSDALMDASSSVGDFQVVRSGIEESTLQEHLFTGERSALKKENFAVQDAATGKLLMAASKTDHIVRVDDDTVVTQEYRIVDEGGVMTCGKTVTQCEATSSYLMSKYAKFAGLETKKDVVPEDDFMKEDDEFAWALEIDRTDSDEDSDESETAAEREVERQKEMEMERQTLLSVELLP